MFWEVRLRSACEGPWMTRAGDVVLHLQLKKSWKYFHDGGERARRSGPPFRETGRQRRESAEGKSSSRAAGVSSLSCSRSRDTLVSNQKP